MGKIINLRVIPKSSRAGVIGWEDGILKVRVVSPPRRGAANRELLELLSDYFQISKNHMKIVSGERSRFKRVLIEG